MVCFTYGEASNHIYIVTAMTLGTVESDLYLFFDAVELHIDYCEAQDRSVRSGPHKTDHCSLPHSASSFETPVIVTRPLQQLQELFPLQQQHLCNSNSCLCSSLYSGCNTRQLLLEQLDPLAELLLSGLSQLLTTCTLRL